MKKATINDKPALKKTAKQVNKELKTEAPISEKDEVKNAESRMRNLQKNNKK